MKYSDCIGALDYHYTSVVAETTELNSYLSMFGGAFDIESQLPQIGEGNPLFPRLFNSNICAFLEEKLPCYNWFSIWRIDGLICGSETGVGGLIR